MRTLVLGLGNLVHSDDGAGIHAVQRLQTDPRVPPDVVVMDGGTLGLGLLPHISGFERLLVIDAIDAGDAPGTLIRLEGRALADMPGRASVHQLGFSDLMVAMKLLGDLPGEVVVFGVQPMSTEWSAELTPAVEKAIGPLLDSVIEQLEAWQEVTIT
jgi:hydrogenase maturation protease